MRLLLCAIVLAAATACSSDKGAPTAPSTSSPPAVTAVEVALQNALLRASETTQVTATAILSNSQTQAVTAGF